MLERLLPEVPHSERRTTSPAHSFDSTCCGGASRPTGHIQTSVSGYSVPAGRPKRANPAELLLLLSQRADKHGRPLTDDLLPAESLDDKHWRVKLRPRSTEMPDAWRVIDCADTCTAFHGIPLSNLYALLYHRILL